MVDVLAPRSPNRDGLHVPKASVVRVSADPNWIGFGQIVASAKWTRFWFTRYDRFARSLRQLVNALEEFRALGIDFISLHEGVDASTPSGRLVFQVIGAMSEFERSLIQERVRAGLRNAVARGVRLGRPRTTVDAAEIARLRASGASWREISEQLGVGVGTVCRAFQTLPKTP